jgi:hypothetical protein
MKYEGPLDGPQPAREDVPQVVVGITIARSLADDDIVSRNSSM